MRIALITSLQFQEHTGARTRATKIYDLLSDNHRVELLNISIHNQSEFPDQFDGVDFSIATGWLPGTVREIIVGWRLLWYLHGEDFDVVWSYEDWQHVPVFAWLASRLFGTSLVVNISDHRSGRGVKGRIVNEWLRKRIYRVADALSIESKTLYPDLDALGVESNRRVLVPTGIDVEAFSRPNLAEREIPTVFYVGRPKDIELLFDSIPLIAEQLSNFEVRLAGVEPADYPSIDSEYITFLGYVPHERVIDELAQAHVCVIPYQEADTAGRPVKILEYMAAKKCIVATDFPFNTQMLSHEDNALVVPPDPEQFAKAIVRTLEDSSLRQALANRAYEDVRADYSLNVMQTRLEETIAAADTSPD